MTSVPQFPPAVGRRPARDSRVSVRRVDRQLPVLFLHRQIRRRQRRGRSLHQRTDAVSGQGALLTCKYLGRPIASLGWQWGLTRYQVLSYLIPLGYSTFTYSIAWLTGIAALNPLQTADAFSRFFGLSPLSRLFGIGLYFLVVATIGVIKNCATTLGEEIGWRGFLVPELAKRFSFTATAVLSGVGCA